MAAAAAAVAAASQWSNATSPGASGHQSAPSLQAAPGAPQLTPSQHSPAALGGGFDSQSPQVAALAAAVAAQQQLAAAAWRWPNPAPQQQQQPNGGAGPAPSPVTNGSTSSGSGQSQQQQQQQVSTGIFNNLSRLFQQPAQPGTFKLDPSMMASLTAALTTTSNTMTMPAFLSGDSNTEEARSAKRARLKVDE